MNLNGWADEAWADGSWVPESWGVETEAEQVVRNFRLRGRKKKDDRYEWLRQPRPVVEVPIVDIQAEAVSEAVEAETLLGRAVDEKAELAARVRLEAAKKSYLDTYEQAYRDSMLDDLTFQWQLEVAQLKRRRETNRRAAFLLLMN